MLRYDQETRGIIESRCQSAWPGDASISGLGRIVTEEPSLGCLFRCAEDDREIQSRPAQSSTGSSLSLALIVRVAQTPSARFPARRRDYPADS